MGVQERIVAQEEAAPPGKMTYEAFLAWLDEDTLAEWVDGEVIVTSPASKIHQALGRFLLHVLDTFVRFRGLGEIIQPPFQMKLKHGREPDLIFVATANLDRLKNTFLDGPADLVIEIVSPESIARDRGDKFVEYEAGGVPEYWLFDPERRSADFYELAGGRYSTAFSGQ
ncbi:MAG TPA: Uma2 family endonuclease, partial [Ardenticatenaceae bacterium]|nr:Uma2 family endonuclease [Ardenticatenaceae bacterium]